MLNSECLRRYIILIPARSGSKGLIDKNIKNFNGRPLIYWSIAAAEYIAEQAKNVEIVISSDSQKYLEIAKLCVANKLEIKYHYHLRSNASSGDGASMVQVVDEILNNFCEKGFGERYTFILLQPTSPIRSKHDIKRAFSELDDLEKSTALVTRANLDVDDVFISNTKSRSVQSIVKMLSVEKKERRQDRTTELFNLDGTFYGFPLFVNGERQNIKHSFEFPENIVISDLDQNIEIDTPIDFCLAQTLHKIYSKKLELELIGL